MTEATILSRVNGFGEHKWSELLEDTSRCPPPQPIYSKHEPTSHATQEIIQWLNCSKQPHNQNYSPPKKRRRNNTNHLYGTRQYNYEVRQKLK